MIEGALVLRADFQAALKQQDGGGFGGSVGRTGDHLAGADLVLGVEHPLLGLAQGREQPIANHQRGRPGGGVLDGGHGLRFPLADLSKSA